MKLLKAYQRIKQFSGEGLNADITKFTVGVFGLEIEQMSHDKKLHVL